MLYEISSSEYGISHGREEYNKRVYASGIRSRESGGHREKALFTP